MTKKHLPFIKHSIAIMKHAYYIHSCLYLENLGRAPLCLLPLQLKETTNDDYRYMAIMCRLFYLFLRLLFGEDGFDRLDPPHLLGTVADTLGLL